MTRARAFDHLVLPCEDLSATVARFEAWGFQVGRRNRHPWGTENHIIQFDGAFIELIALASDYRPLATDDDAFPFAGFLAGQGGAVHPSAMLVLRSSDAKADAELFQASGIGEDRTLDSARSGIAPDGTERTVAFSLAFATIPAAPRLGFFVCQQHRPENFWDPARQRHGNGVRGLAEIVIAAPRPAVLAEPMAQFASATAISSDADMLLRLDGGTLLRLQPGAGEARLTGIRFASATPTRHEHWRSVDLVFGP